MKEAQGFDVSAIMGKKKLQIWVKFNDQMEVLINYVPREQFAAIMKEATETTWDRRHQAQETFDHIKFGELLGAEAVADWKGPVADGAPIPCTVENIGKFMRNWLAFAKFIGDICTDLEHLVAVEREALRKNSEFTSGQGLTTQG